MNLARKKKLKVKGIPTFSCRIKIKQKSKQKTTTCFELLIIQKTEESRSSMKQDGAVTQNFELDTVKGSII